MANGSGKTQEISLGGDFDAVVRYGGTTVELGVDGNVVVKTKGNAIVYTNGDVKVRPAANDDGKATATGELKAGARMPDGTVYAGISPDTGKAMFTTPADAQSTYTFNQARTYAAKLDAHGRRDWRIPSKRELDVLFRVASLSAASINPVRIPAAGTGRLRRPTTMRGPSGSPTGVSTSPGRISTRPCGVSAEAVSRKPGGSCSDDLPPSFSLQISYISRI